MLINPESNYRNCGVLLLPAGGRSRQISLNGTCIWTLDQWIDV